MFDALLSTVSTAVRGGGGFAKPSHRSCPRKQDCDSGKLSLAGALAGLERSLGQRTYVAGTHAPSLADVVLVCELRPLFEQARGPDGARDLSTRSTM